MKLKLLSAACALLMIGMMPSAAAERELYWGTAVVGTGVVHVACGVTIPCPPVDYPVQFHGWTAIAYDIRPATGVEPFQSFAYMYGGVVPIEHFICFYTSSTGQNLGCFDSPAWDPMAMFDVNPLRIVGTVPAGATFVFVGFGAAPAASQHMWIDY